MYLALEVVPLYSNLIKDYTQKLYSLYFTGLLYPLWNFKFYINIIAG